MRHGYVLKRHLNVREAWEIGINDIDVAGVVPDDDVQIPGGREVDAPVLQLLEWKRQKSRSLDQSDLPGDLRANRNLRD